MIMIKMVKEICTCILFVFLSRREEGVRIERMDGRGRRRRRGRSTSDS